MKSSSACLLLSISLCACADGSGETAATPATSSSTGAIDEASSSTGGAVEPTTSSTGSEPTSGTGGAEPTPGTAGSTTVDTTADLPTSTTDTTTGGGDAAPCEAEGDALVYFDDFETVVPGESFVGRGADGFVWSDAAYVDGSDLNASSGSRAARFNFKGGGDEATAELRFDLGGDYREVTLEFRLYMPNGGEPYGGAAYRHRNHKNNKFFRLWPGSAADYNSGEKLGASLWGMEESDSESLLLGDWSKDGSGAVGPGLTQDPAPGFLGAADQGAWQTIRIDVRAPTAKGSGPAALAIGKNGEVLSEEAPDNFTEGEPHSFRFGYLLGYANSGFDEDTLVFIDDVCVIARP